METIFLVCMLLPFVLGGLFILMMLRDALEPGPPKHKTPLDLERERKQQENATALGREWVMHGDREFRESIERLQSDIRDIGPSWWERKG